LFYVVILTLSEVEWGKNPRISLLLLLLSVLFSPYEKLLNLDAVHLCGDL